MKKKKGVLFSLIIGVWNKQRSEGGKGKEREGGGGSNIQPKNKTIA